MCDDRGRYDPLGACENQRTQASTWPGPRRVSTQRKPTSRTELTSASLDGQAVAALLQRLWFRQPVALVLDVDGDLGQRLGMLAAMVRAEKQFSRVSE